MKIETPKNPNYAATVVRVRHINTLPNCDNVVGVPVLGYQAITSKNTQVGDLVLAFGAETQLSLAYAGANNLHRHAELNSDPEVSGYLEDNRRIKAIKFRGHRSDALLMPLSSLSGFFSEWDQLKEGDTFDHLDGKEICRKYEVRQPRQGVSGQQVKRASEKRVDEVLFPKHFDTTSFFRVPFAIRPDDYVTVTQKLHGTSVRIAHTLVKRKLSWRERAARKLGIPVREQEWAYVYGSRNVIKDPDNPFAQDFYGSDIHTEVGQRVKGLLPKGWIAYGEIVGWVPGTNTPIQKGYTYRIPEGSAELYIYRIVSINEDGRTVDLSWSAVKEFCRSVGLKTVPELDQVINLTDDLVQAFMDQRYADYPDAFPEAVPTDARMVDEGVCLRVEGITPLVLKAKSPEFLRHETKMIDKGALDVEAEEGVQL